MRAFLLLLLCLTIPVQGVVAAHAFKTPCPMEQMGHMDMADSDSADNDSADMDCCNDPVTAAKTGQLCKVGQECPSGGLGILVSTEPNDSPSIRLLTMAFSPPLNPHPKLSSIWRPPTLR